MGSEVWVFKCTKLTTKTKKQRLKIYSRGWIFKNTLLKKRRRKKKEKKSKKTTTTTKQSHKNYLKTPTTTQRLYMVFALKK